MAVRAVFMIAGGARAVYGVLNCHVLCCSPALALQKGSKRECQQTAWSPRGVGYKRRPIATHRLCVSSLRRPSWATVGQHVSSQEQAAFRGAGVEFLGCWMTRRRWGVGDGDGPTLPRSPVSLTGKMEFGGGRTYIAKVGVRSGTKRPRGVLLGQNNALLPGESEVSGANQPNHQHRACESKCWNCTSHQAQPGRIGCWLERRRGLRMKGGKSLHRYVFD